MDGVSPATRLALPIAPIGAAVLAAIAGFGVLVAPTALLEGFAVDSGIAAVIRAAEPPLGLTARAVMMVAAAGVVGAFAWVLLDLLGAGRVLRARPKPAEPLQPVRATRDLGVPLMDVTAAKAPPRPLPDVERDLPKNLDVPLALFDPGAVPAVPAEPVPLVAALAKPRPEPEPEAPLDLVVRAPEPAVELLPPVAEMRAPEPKPIEPAADIAAARALRATLADGPARRITPLRPEPALAPAPAERWEVVALPTPPVTRPPERTERPTEATIQALLTRLERGVAQKTGEAAAAESRQPWPSLSDTLGELRALAAAR